MALLGLEYYFNIECLQSAHKWPPLEVHTKSDGPLTSSAAGSLHLNLAGTDHRTSITVVTEARSFPVLNRMKRTSLED